MPHGLSEGFCRSSEAPTLFPSCREKNVFTMKRSGSYLNQMIKFSVTKNGTT